MLFSRPFGIELESTLGSNQAYSIGNANRGFSPSSEHCGSEIRTPICTHEDWPRIRQVTQAMRSAGAGLDRHCGLHVHLDMRGSDFDTRHRWPALWLTLEPALFMLVAPSRRDNGFCRKASNTVNYYLRNYINRGRNDAWGQDYWWESFDEEWCALVPYTHHGSTEVRIHHGTLNCQRMKHWVMLLQTLIRVTERSTGESLQQWELAARMPIPSVVQYMADLVKSTTKEHTATYILDGINDRLVRYGNPTIQVH